MTKEQTHRAEGDNRKQENVTPIVLLLSYPICSSEREGLFVNCALNR